MFTQGWEEDRLREAEEKEEEEKRMEARKLENPEEGEEKEEEEEESKEESKEESEEESEENSAVESPLSSKGATKKKIQILRQLIAEDKRMVESIKRKISKAGDGGDIELLIYEGKLFESALKTKKFTLKKLLDYLDSEPPPIGPWREPEGTFADLVFGGKRKTKRRRTRRKKRTKRRRRSKKRRTRRRKTRRKYGVLEDTDASMQGDRKKKRTKRRHTKKRKSKRRRIR